jgi:hypothetical protein
MSTDELNATIAIPAPPVATTPTEPTATDALFGVPVIVAPVPPPAPPSPIPGPDVFGNTSHEKRVVAGKAINRTRWYCPMTGSTFYKFRQDALPRGPKDPFPDVLTVDKSPAQIFTDRFHGGVRSGVLDAPTDQPLRDELASLKRLGLHLVAELLEAAHPPAEKAVDPDVLFSPGENVRVLPSLAKLIVMYSEEVKTYLARHIRGDHGLHGSTLGLEADDTEDWCPVLFTVARQNFAAITTGSGIVRSKYHVGQGVNRHSYGEPDPTFNVPARRHDDYVEIWTLMAAPREPKTYIFSSRDTSF